MKYSIITPVYNREDCIERCLKSVCKQIQGNIGIEHIVVDDGSTDATHSIVKTYEKKHSHVKYIQFPNNHGTNAARNAAIAAATGDFCILLDSDDYFVDDAILFINSVVKKYSDIMYFTFAPDDMQRLYVQNDLLKKESAILNYSYFLTGKISGDFIHVIHSAIMKKYPFDESLRIYEDVFFLLFYKEAQEILFTNRVVTIRERSRCDSVTRETIRTKDTFINRNIKALELFINWYAGDLMQLNALSVLGRKYKSLLDNYLLVSKYKDAKKILAELKRINQKISLKHMIVFKLHLGWLYKLALQSYLIAKYKVFKKRLQ